MIIIQCRQHSARFPDKWKHEIDGVSMLDRVYDACEQTNIRPIVVACSKHDNEISEYCHNRKYLWAMPDISENDLISRFILVMTTVMTTYAKQRYERCLRITADCPYHFPQEMEWIWRHGQDVDFCSNGWPYGRTTIDGVDCETYSLRLLRWMDRNIKELKYREHLPLCFYEIGFPPQFTNKYLDWPVNLSHIKTSIDTPKDIERLKEEELI